MGERVEIVTWRHHRRNFYKVTGGAFAFEVKGEEAVIWLTSKLYTTNNNDYKIKMSSHEGCYILLNEPYILSRAPSVTDVLSSTEFKRYWLKFYGNRISFGKNGETHPILSLDASTKDIKYISFDMEHCTTPVYWKFDLPPIVQKRPLKPIVSGSMEWVAAETQLPPNALVAGSENEFLFIIRATHRGSLTPGKFVPSLGLGFICWGGDSHEKSEFEVLCGYDCKWVDTEDGQVPPNAVVGGYSEVNREPLYVGRVEHNGYLIPGKVQPSHKVCYIPYKDKEIGMKYHQVLVHADARQRHLQSMSVRNVVHLADDYDYNDLDLGDMIGNHYFARSDSDNDSYDNDDDDE